MTWLLVLVRYKRRIRRNVKSPHILYLEFKNHDIEL